MDKYTICFYVRGPLTADLAMIWNMEHVGNLIHACAVSTDDQPPYFAIAGSEAGTVLSSTLLGETNRPEEWAFADFDTYVTNRAFPRFIKGETVTVTVTRQESTSPANIAVVLTFLDE